MLNLLIRNRKRKVDAMDAKPPTKGNVVAAHTTPDHQPGVLYHLGDGSNRLALLLAHGRNANLQLRHPQLIKGTGDI